MVRQNQCLFVNDKCKEHQSLLQQVLSGRTYIDRAEDPNSEDVSLVWCDYEDIPWEGVLAGKLRCNAFCVRKGLIRKANFAAIHEAYAAKYPDSALAKGVPSSYVVEMHHPDDIDEAVCELPASVVVNENHSPWILKLSVIEKADHSIIFTEIDQLKEKLEELSELDIREFVVQRYVDRPLLCDGRKFSMRAYVLAVGDLEVFLWDDVFCFLCTLPYDEVEKDFTNRFQHITNFNVNVHHDDWSEDRCSFLLPQLVDKLGADAVASIQQQIEAISRDLFQCMHSYPTVFMPLPGCFELYGLDFVVDVEGHVMLLESNAGPALNHLGKKFFDNGVKMYNDIFEMAIDPFHKSDDPIKSVGDVDLELVGKGGWSRKVYSKRTEYRYKGGVSMQFQ